MPTKNYYVLDTSAFIVLHHTDRDVIGIPQRIWDELSSLMESDTVISHRCVYDEIVPSTIPENPDRLSGWIANRKKYFQQRNGVQAVEVQKIIQKFPKLINPKKEIPDADPWVIALAIERRQQPKIEESKVHLGYAVVTQENPRSPEKMPEACKRFGVRCIKLSTFLDEVGIRLG